MARTPRAAAATPRPRRRAAAATEAGTASVTAAAEEGGADKSLTVKLLIERVVARTDLKKKEAKTAVEAALAVLGDAMAAGETLNLPPFGKMRVNRKKDKANGESMTLRMRRGSGGRWGGQKADENAKEPLAAADE